MASPFNFVEGFAVLAALFNFVEGFAVQWLAPFQVQRLMFNVQGFNDL